MTELNDDATTDDMTLVQQFERAIHELEDSSDVEALAGLYGDDCSVGNIVDGEAFDGLDGARRFWTIYREQFGDLHSEFSVVAGDDTGAVLEWTTNGTIDGDEVSYRGATVLEIADGRIIRSMAYYDPADLGRQIVAEADTNATN